MEDDVTDGADCGIDSTRFDPNVILSNYIGQEETWRFVVALVAKAVGNGMDQFSDLVESVWREIGKRRVWEIRDLLEHAWERFRDAEYGDDKSMFPHCPIDMLIGDPPDERLSKRDDQLAVLDELFCATVQYKSSREYLDLLEFIARFPKYSPYNCFLLHVQNPEVSYLATARQWSNRFGRRVKEGARPLVILAPMSPVLFVFDMADTEGDKPLPKKLIDPFATEGQVSKSQWERTKANLIRDRIRYVECKASRRQAGRIMPALNSECVTQQGNVVSALYRLEVNGSLDKGGKYATLAHELGHLYAGHLGTPNDRWWPSRCNMTKEQVEFEAESIAYLVCARAGIKNPSAAYLHHYLQDSANVPDISLDTVLKAAHAIEDMRKRRLPPRVEKKSKAATK